MKRQSSTAEKHPIQWWKRPPKESEIVLSAQVQGAAGAHFPGSKALFIS
jgi:hypothetical protein